MPIIANFTEVDDATAVAHIRNHIAKLPPPPPPKFNPGDAVRLDSGDIGVVAGDEDGMPAVYYLDREGIVSGPSIGWELTKLDL